MRRNIFLIHKSTLSYLLVGCTAVIITFGLGLLLYLPYRASQADAVIESKINHIMDAVQRYADTNEKLPASLKDVNSSTIKTDGLSYKVLSDSSYQLCAVYPRQSKPRCNHYEPYIPIPDPVSATKDGKTMLCGNQVNYYLGYGPYVKTVDSSIYLNNSQNSTSVQFLTVGTANVPGDAGNHVYMYGPGSIIYDKKCSELLPSQLKAGDTLVLYDATSTDRGAITMFLRQ